MRDVQLVFPAKVQELLRSTIASTGGNEVFFLGRLSWSRAGGSRGGEASPSGLDAGGCGSDGGAKGSDPRTSRSDPTDGSTGQGASRDCGTGPDDAGQPVATLEEVDVLARGNATSVPAVIQQAEGWDLAIHNHPSGRLEPSDADMAIACELAARSVGFAIISNDAGRCYLVVSPFEERAEQVLVDPEEVRSVFAPDGPIAALLGDYEAREGQVEMALEVARALNEDRVLAAEAGTGVGKSFAYLVPAILWSLRNRRRVVVSTGTINLQEQLTGKDLPFLAKALPVAFRFALIKGRGNYACRRKAEELEGDLQQRELFAEDERRQLQELVEWVKVTRDGSRSDLAWVPPAAVWEQAMSETDKSLKVKCKHYHECFYYEAKRAAAKAHILVVNHHLFFADLGVRRETGNYDREMVIPPYQRVIFDEAHHLEDAASEHFGVNFSRTGIRARLARLLSTRDHRRGAIPVLVRRLRVLGDPVAADAIDRSYVHALIEARERIEDDFHDIEEALRGLPPGLADARRSPGRARTAALEERAPARGAEQGSGEPPGLQLRYRGDSQAGPFWDRVLERLQDLQKELGLLLAVNDRALGTLETSTLPGETVASQSLELQAFGSRLKSLMAQIERFRDVGETGQVRWIASREERRRREGEEAQHRRGLAIELASAPIRVDEALRSAVFDPLKTVVLTSATLSVGGKIDFLADRLGLGLLGGERFEFREHASPFDFRRQAVTAVPTDFPLPESREFEREVPEAVFKIVRATGGRAFVLFTSYGLLRRTHAGIAPRLADLGLRPMAQGEAPRSELLERFRARVGSVLFGTDSFWEGVDVKGRALECVVITRLPFRVPSEPVQEARWEELEARGENPFTSFTVPQAVLKLKQGFGRLIRSRSDRGVVVVLDRRILTKPYGRVFLASLPETAVVRAPLAEVIRRIEGFFAGEAPQGEPLPEARLPGGAPPWEVEGGATGEGGTAWADEAPRQGEAARRRESARVEDAPLGDDVGRHAPDPPW